MASRLTASEEVKQKFREYSTQLLESVPELRSVCLITDWEAGNESLPSGFLHSRGVKEATHTTAASVILALCQQTLKVLLSQLQHVDNVLTEIKRHSTSELKDKV